MNNVILLRFAYKSLLHHKGRSALTILGIIIGIGSIIALMAIGKGAEEKIKQSIMTAGKNFIYLSPEWPPQTKHGKRRKLIKDITYKYTQTLKKLCPGIKYVSPMSYSEAKIKNKSVAEIDFPIVGCNEDHIKIADRTMMKGTFIQQYHVQNSAKVIVLGFAAAEQLFKNTNPLGQIVEVNKINFTVIGVLQKINDSGSHNDPNKDCYAPVSSVKKYLKQSFDGVLNGIFIASQNDKVIPETIRQITKIMRAQHKLDKDDPNDFAIYDQKGMLAAAQKSSDIFTLFLLIVAFIALLIGGIGVMNIMLVAVGERTQEIGIRKAVGATQSTILKQFILEALTLCIIGGIIGIILGIAVPLLVSKFTGLPVIFTTMSIIIVTITIIFVGLIFGYYPALKAANMNPINALSD